MWTATIISIWECPDHPITSIDRDNTKFGNWILRYPFFRPRLLTRPVHNSRTGGWPQTIMPTRAERRGARANSRTTRSGNGTSSTSGRAESVIDRVVGSRPPIRGQGSKGGHEERRPRRKMKIRCIGWSSRARSSSVSFSLPYVGRRLPSGRRYHSRVGVERAKFLLSLSLSPLSDDPPTLSPSGVRQSRRGRQTTFDIGVTKWNKSRLREAIKIEGSERERERESGSIESTVHERPRDLSLGDEEEGGKEREERKEKRGEKEERRSMGKVSGLESKESNEKRLETMRERERRGGWETIEKRGWRVARVRFESRNVARRVKEAAGKAFWKLNYLCRLYQLIFLDFPALLPPSSIR